ncbi:MAG: hypothetical protein HOY79_40310 [Streptomyces sp.]|nr:hypothetical protein [Streptomyces sp.]
MGAVKALVPEVTATVLTTAGQPQLLVIDCPGCGCTHRHLEAGERRGPCGTRYAIVTPERPTP